MRFANPLKRTRQVVSTTGHSVEFPGKEADGTLAFVHVPPALEAEAIAAGLVPESDVEEPVASTGPVRPTNPEELKAAVFEGFGKMVDRGDREDFAGNGFPKVDLLSALLGWRVEAREVKDLWPQFQAAEQEAKP